MFALAAFVCFLIALFDEWLGWQTMVTLGAMFIALHLLWPLMLPLPTWGRRG